MRNRFFIVFTETQRYRPPTQAVYSQSEGREGETTLRAQVERIWVQNGYCVSPNHLSSAAWVLEVASWQAIGPAGWSLTTRGHHFAQFRYGVGSLGPELREKTAWSLVGFLVGWVFLKNLLESNSISFHLGLS